MTPAQRANTKRAEQLKDRRDYRATLIRRIEDSERRMKAVEEQIRKLEGKA